MSTTVQTINRSRKVKFCQTLRVQKRESGAQVNEADIYDEMARFDEEIGTPLKDRQHKEQQKMIRGRI